MDVSFPGWTDAELDEGILKLCEEFPDVRMVDCSRVLEYCRRAIPRGSPASLLTAMRDLLQQEARSPRATGGEMLTR